ncbi:MAG: hypothetical protein WC759_00100 [Candidatus Micrarchaeia archaeon]
MEKCKNCPDDKGKHCISCGEGDTPKECLVEGCPCKQFEAAT